MICNYFQDFFNGLAWYQKRDLSQLQFVLRFPYNVIK